MCFYRHSPLSGSDDLEQWAGAATESIVSAYRCGLVPSMHGRELNVADRRLGTPCCCFWKASNVRSHGHLIFFY